MDVEEASARYSMSRPFEDSDGFLPSYLAKMMKGHLVP